MSSHWVIAASFLYVALLFAIATWGDRRAREGRSVIDSPWVYTLSLGVYCTAWTYFGSVGRAASAGIWFLPIYLGPTLAMILAWLVLRKMVRIAKTHRITTIADFIGSRYGKSPAVAGCVTGITVVGIVPYIALQLKAVSVAYAVMTMPPGALPPDRVAVPWWGDTTLYIALALAGFAMVFGARRLDSAERHEGMVTAIAFESVVKLVAFVAVGCLVTWGLFNGPGHLFSQAHAHEDLKQLLTLGSPESLPYTRWFALTLLAMLSVLLLPRQFQIMVTENVNERHIRRAAWGFPLYLLLINLFVLPIAFGGQMLLGSHGVDPDTYILMLPLSQDYPWLALLAFIGGFSAATGMVVVETIAVSTMVSNDLVMPLLLRAGLLQRQPGRDLSRMLLLIRRVAIGGVLCLGYVYFHLAGEVHALVSIGLISFAAVAQFGPALLGGLYWKGGTRDGALAGLSAGFIVWAYTLMLPSFAKSGWMAANWLQSGPLSVAWLRPEALFGLDGLDPLTHSLFWSLTVNALMYAVVSSRRSPNAREASQALLFVDALKHTGANGPVFWRGTAQVKDLKELTTRLLGAAHAQALFATGAAGGSGDQPSSPQANAELVQRVETHLAGAIGTASARVMVASVAQEESLRVDDVLKILEETSQIRAHSLELEEKSRSLELATAELRRVNEQLTSLDALKDDFMSSVTHELRTPLTSIRALAEMMHDDPDIDTAQRQQFVGIIVAEATRLSRLVNQVLDMAKIESGHAEWSDTPVDLSALIQQAVQSTAELFRERHVTLTCELPPVVPPLMADPDRLMQVLVNLLSNAVKFTPGEGGRVSVRLLANEQGVGIRVEDNGPGVPEAERQLVFEKFRQGSSGPVHRPQGTGLGLPICRRIVEHFGGRIWVEAASLGGACFAFDIPWLHPQASAPEPPSPVAPPFSTSGGQT